MAAQHDGCWVVVVVVFLFFRFGYCWNKWISSIHVDFADKSGSQLATCVLCLICATGCLTVQSKYNQTTECLIKPNNLMSRCWLRHARTGLSRTQRGSLNSSVCDRGMCKTTARRHEKLTSNRVQKRYKVTGSGYNLNTVAKSMKETYLEMPRAARCTRATRVQMLSRPWPRF